MSAMELLQAAGKGDITALTRLLDGGGDPNAAHPATGATALYNACFTSQIEAVRLLLARGADPNQRITYRSPIDGRLEKDIVALMVASSGPLVATLLDAGADPTVRDGDGQSVLMRLVGVAPPRVFETLINAGADVAARSNDGRSAADLVRRKLDWWRRFAPTKNPEHQADLETILALLLGQA